MLFLLLDGMYKIKFNIGLLEILKVLIGDMMVFFILNWVKMY